MTHKFYTSFFIIILIAGLTACNNGPKVITPSTDNGNIESKGVFSPDPATQVMSDGTTAVGNELHKVMV